MNIQQKKLKIAALVAHAVQAAYNAGRANGGGGVTYSMPRKDVEALYLEDRNEHIFELYDLLKMAEWKDDYCI